MEGFCSPLILTSGGLTLGLFAAGLVGGFTHCAGMCGPFVIAQAGGAASGSVLRKISASALIPYHLGRMTTYVGLAVAVNSALGLIFAVSPLRALIAAPMLALAGVIFLTTAFPKMAAVFPWASRLALPAPQKWIEAASAPLMRAPGALKHYALGVLLGFMPCGLVLSALLAASSASHVWLAALSMAAFAAGTVPALIMTAAGGHAFKAAFPRFSDYAFRGVMAFNGLWLLAMAGFLLKQG